MKIGTGNRSKFEKLAVLACLLAFCLALTACAGRRSSAKEPEPVPEDWIPKSGLFDDTAEDDTGGYWPMLLESMTLEEKIGQMIIIRPDQLDPTRSDDWTSGSAVVTEISPEMEERLRQYPVGGFIIFGGNLESPGQLADMIGKLNSNSRFTPFIAVDEEGGNVARIGNSASKGFVVKRYRSAAAVGAGGDPAAAYEMGSTIGQYLRGYGFNLDFAPVADVNTNPRNQVIGTRAFSPDPATAAAMVSAFIDGLHENSVLSCTKHFPGHGDTTADTHHGYVAVNKTWEELLAAEIIPFKESLDKTDLVMVAHLTLPQVTGDGLPASISGELITGRLKGELGYKGLVTTDSLAMSAISKNYSAADTAVMAVLAGVDILMNPANMPQSFEALVNAVRSGQISEDRINDSVLRILKLKARLQ